MLIRFFSLVAAFAITAGCHRHDHPEHDSGHEHGAEPVRHTAWTEACEWFVELECPEPGKPAVFAAHLTLLKDFSPATEGSFTVTARSGSLVAHASVDMPSRPGIFMPEIIFPTDGRWTLTLEFASRTLRDSIAYEVEVPPACRKTPEAKPAGAVSFLKEQQWMVPFDTARAARRALAEYREVYAKILPRREAHAVVLAPASGRFVPPESGPIPPGAAVRQGSILGFFEPILSGPQGTTHLLNHAALVQVELELSKSRQRLERAARELERTRTLFEQKAKSKRQLEEAELEHQFALAAAESAERLLQRLGSAGAEGMRTPVICPVSGTVARACATPGVFVAEHTELFEIADLSTVLVEARVHETDLGLLRPDSGAYVTTPAYPGEAFEGGRLLYVGSIVDPETRTLPVAFELENPGGRLKLGMAVTAHLDVRPRIEVVAVPESSVLDEDGVPVVFVQIEGENFVRRAVRLGRRDRGWVEIEKGVAEGERVVTRGAHFIRLASLRIQAPVGHGHPH